MEIRSLEDETDLREALRVHGRAWTEAYDDFLPESVLEEVASPPSDEELRKRFETLRDECFLVAVDDSETVRGYAYFRWGEEVREFVGSNEAGLKEIYVHPDHWGQGIGSDLLERGLERLPDDRTALKLGMFSENDVGQQFYERQGFEQSGTTTTTVGGETHPITIYSLDL